MRQIKMIKNPKEIKSRIKTKMNKIKNKMMIMRTKTLKIKQIKKIMKLNS
jgi:hypothetical protein